MPAFGSPSSVMSICSENWNIALNAFSVFAYTISALLFISISIFHFKARQDLHPIFVTSFMTILISYAVCDVTAVIFQALSFVNGSSSVMSILYIIYQASYIATSPCVVITLIERYCATVRTNSYEYSRPWGPYYIALLVSTLVVGAHTFIAEYASNIFFTQVILFLISVVILACLTVLLVVNRKLVLKSRGKCHLSKRYQITENVKSLRLLVPVVVLDTLVSITDMTALIFFAVDSTFEPDKCAKSPLYLPAYIFLRMLSLIFEVAIPLAVMHRHHAFRRALEKYISRTPTGTPPTSGTVHYDKKTLKIKNILGMDISPSENVDHFDVLQQHWMKKF